MPYTPSGNPIAGALARSADIRAEFVRISVAFNEVLSAIATASLRSHDSTLTGTTRAEAVIVAGPLTAQTGTLTATPTAATHIVPKSYVDAADNLRATKASPTFTGTVTSLGPVVIPRFPSSNTHATSRAYVDDADNRRAPKASPTFTGTVTIPGPSQAQHAATKQYVDTTVAARSLPSGTVMLFRQPAAPAGWTKVTTNSVNDAMLRVVTGNTADRVTGAIGVSSGFSAGRTLGAHTLTEAQIPSHRHFVLADERLNYNFPWPNSTNRYLARGHQTAGDHEGQNSYRAGGSLREPTIARTSVGTGGNQAHSHTLGFSIKYVDVIVARKN